MSRLKQFDEEIIKRPKSEKPSIKIAVLKRQIAKLREELKEKDVTKRTIKKQEQYKYYRRTRYRIGIKTNDMRLKAVDIFFSRVKRDLKRKSAYFDVISGYPILVKFVEQQKIHHELLCILIISYHFRWINRKELVFYGYTYPRIVTICKMLVEKGYMVVDKPSGTKQYHYICMPKGERLVEQFHDYYRKQTRLMFDEFDKKHKYHTIKPTKIRRKEVLKVVDEDEDKQAN